MRCPKCDSENDDSAKFCKKCGTPLKNNQNNTITSVNGDSRGNNTTKYVIIALVIVVIVLAGVFAYVYGFGQHSSDSQLQSAQNSQNADKSNQNVDDSDNSVEAQSSGKTAHSSSLSILGGSFSTGSELEDKTYASINVGSEHAGEQVTVQIFYSRDGSTLNNGNMVPVTVNSSGYIEVSSADSYKYFPDYAQIKIFDSSGNLLDSKDVSLSPQSGTQTF